MSAKQRVRLKSTQKLIPIREISDGVILTKDNRYIKILEVLPINFLMKSASEQNKIARAFRDLFKTGPPTLQFKVISRRANMTRHMQLLKEDIMTETSQKCTEMQLEYLKLLKSEGMNGSMTRRFFLAFEYSHEDGVLQRLSKEEIVAKMNNTARRIKNALAECGNEVVNPDDENEQMEEILYSIFNPEKSAKLPFEDYRKQISDKYSSASVPGLWPGNEPYIPVTDLIAPERVDFPKAYDYMVINGKYVTYAYVPADGYNPEVITGWLSPFINASEGIDTDIFFNRVPKERLMFKLRQSLNQSRASLADTSDTQSSYESLKNSIAAIEHILDGIAAGEDFYYMAIFVTISGDTRKQMEWKFNELKKLLSTMDIKLQKCLFEMKAAFESSMPLCRVDQDLWQKARRNLLTSGAATTYPFTAFEIMDEDGILFGRNTMNNSLAIVDIFNTKVYKNCNIFIAGTTGAGKTFSLLLIAMRMRISHIPVVIIAPEKEHEFERVATAMDGQFIRFGSGSPHCINIMEIFKTDDMVSNVLDGGSIISSRLAEKVQDLKTFFKLLIPDIDYEEKELLDEAMMQTYYKKGITEDNDSLIDPENPDRYREMPILGDLYDIIKEIPGLSRVSNIIKVLVTGSGKSFNSQTNVNLNNDFVVLGLEHLSDDLLPVGMFMAIDYAWSKIKEDRTRKKALMIDEWWRFAFDPLAADYSLKIAKTIRAYGGSLILATQQMSDIFAIENGKYGEGVLNNCKIKILMQLEEQDARGVQKIMMLTDAEKDRITRFKQGEALLAANSNSVTIMFESNRTEFDLITTDRKSLEAQALAKMTEEERERFLAKRRKELDRIITDYMDAEPEEYNGEIFSAENPENAAYALVHYFDMEDLSDFMDFEDYEGPIDRTDKKTVILTEFEDFDMTMEEGGENGLHDA